MNELSFTGGARIGRANATKPFAKLMVTKDRLELNASVLGKLVFLPEDVIAIAPFSGLGSSGISIKHKIADYKEEVVFWTGENPEGIINKIKAIGFLGNNGPVAPYIKEEVRQLQASGPSPMKKTVTVAMVGIWNVLFVIGIWQTVETQDIQVATPFFLAALVFVIVFALLTLAVPPFTRLVLKEGRKVSDVKTSLLFLMFITAFIACGMFFIGGLGSK